MPDFNNDLTPILKENSQPKFGTHVWAAKSVAPHEYALYFADTRDNVKEKGKSLEELSKESKSEQPKGVWVSDAELAAHKEYPFYNPTIPNYKDAAASGQYDWGIVLGIILIIGFVFVAFINNHKFFTQKIKNLTNSTIKSSNTQKPIAADSLSPQKPIATEKVIAELERVQKLRKKGVLNEEEFENLKKSILT